MGMGISIREILASGGILMAAAALIQIAPIQINPLSFIAKALGRAINGELLEKVDDLSSDLQLLRKESEGRDAILIRARILRFGDEIYQGILHSKEHFDQILSDITRYERYCENHPDFENNQAIITIQNIKSIYQKCLEEHKFL